MKLPSYQDRTKAELRAAFRWGLRKLHLQHWDARLQFDGRFCDNPRFKSIAGAEGGTASCVAELLAYIGVDRAGCEAEDVDPLHVLFHEVAHLAAATIADTIDIEGCVGPLWEQHANRMALVLFDLYELEKP